jgi:hypothetical protein
LRAIRRRRDHVNGCRHHRIPACPAYGPGNKKQQKTA